jgi:hypothetical protein
MAFLIVNHTASIQPIDDIGFEVPASSYLDLANVENGILADSVDLKTLVDAGTLSIKLSIGYLDGKHTLAGWSCLPMYESIEIEDGAVSINTKYEKQGGFIKHTGFIKGSA